MESELREAKIEEKEIDKNAMQECLSANEALQFQESLAKAKKKVSRLIREIFER